MLSKGNIRISMTEENHCYENAIAERVNGILKDEFYLDQCFMNTHNACAAIKSAIYIYNNKRLNLSLGYKIPNWVFKMQLKSCLTCSRILGRHATIENSTLFEHLRQHIDKFVPISNSDFENLTVFFKPLYLKKKKFIHRQNEVCLHIAFVHKGCLRNYHIDSKGEEQIIYFALEDWWVADLQSFFLQIPSQFNLQALEDCELLVSTKREFEQAFEVVPAFEKFYRLKTQTAYTKTQESVVEKSETAENRYKKLLTSSPSLLQRVPQHYIASYLGIKPQSLSRIRKKVLNSN